MFTMISKDIKVISIFPHQNDLLPTDEKYSEKHSNDKFDILSTR